LEYNDYLKIDIFLGYIPENLAEFVNEQKKNGSDRHHARLMTLVNELHDQVINELIPTVELVFGLFREWKKCR
jgi:hypothetical protein